MAAVVEVAVRALHQEGKHFGMKGVERVDVVVGVVYHQGIVEVRGPLDRIRPDGEGHQGQRVVRLRGPPFRVSACLFRVPCLDGFA